MQRESVFKRYFLPGFVFQSVVIAGGYGTGRELAEFFLTIGPLDGLVAMVLVSTVVWSAVAAASFELARVYGCYDYRSFFQRLLGRGWFLYELCYFALMLIVLAVIAAAAGSILQELLGLPYAAGVIAIMAAVGFLAFRGTTLIETFFVGWSFLLYGVYIVFFIWCFVRFGPAITDGFGAERLGSDWIVAGVKYAAYNLALIPAILFTVRHATTRREAVGAGLLAGPIAMFPGLLFYIAMVGQYPHILQETVPANFLLELLGSRAFQFTFQIVLFGTLVETGTGMIHALNERLAARFHERGVELPSYARPVIAVVLLIVGALVASVGLIDLIAKGYGTLTWLFLLVFVGPVLTLGIWKIRQQALSTSTTDGVA